jgi:hypothetical protein
MTILSFYLYKTKEYSAWVDSVDIVYKPRINKIRHLIKNYNADIKTRIRSRNVPVLSLSALIVSWRVIGHGIRGIIFYFVISLIMFIVWLPF